MFKVLTFLVITLASAQLYASSSNVLSRYRDVALGESLQTVLERLRLVASDVKVLYEVPFVQEVTWKPQRFVGRSTSTDDTLAELVLTFHLGHLARIIAVYDRERTAGLTDADLHELLSATYGVSLLHSTWKSFEKVGDSTLTRQTISSWADADSEVVLWRMNYPARVGLTITATATDRAIQEAIADAAALEAKNAPQRERDRQAAADGAAKDRDARIRLENKAKFKP
jgi:hypothetical protein